MTANLAAALALKDQGNALYKARDFNGALEKYDQAIGTFGEDLTLYNNKAAVLVEMGGKTTLVSSVFLHLLHSFRVCFSP
jgi:hypothetical protein